MDFTMNMLCFCSYITKVFYSGYMRIVLEQAQQTDDFYKFGMALDIFDAINLFDAAIYVLMALSVMKTLVFWQPDTFKVFIELLGSLLSRQTTMMVLAVVLMSLMTNFFISLAIGTNFYGFSSTLFVSIRSACLISQGWFWQRSSQFMIEENLTSLDGMQLLYIYASLSFYVIIFTIVVAGIYIGRVL